MSHFESEKHRFHFQTPEELQIFLEESNSADFKFRIYPLTGKPETFHYSSADEEIVGETDDMSFESPDDFACYAFQCDEEGYANIEYVDFEVLN